MKLHPLTEKLFATWLEERVLRLTAPAVCFPDLRTQEALVRHTLDLTQEPEWCEHMEGVKSVKVEIKYKDGSSYVREPNAQDVCPICGTPRPKEGR